MTAKDPVSGEWSAETTRHSRPGGARPDAPWPLDRVVVLGNGPVGQTAALLLARWGVPAIVLDQRAERDLVGSKAICQQRDVLDIWESVGAGARIAATAQHVHGGIGIDTTYPLHRYFLWAKHNELTLGSATQQLVHLGSTYPEGRL